MVCNDLLGGREYVSGRVRFKRSIKPSRDLNFIPSSNNKSP